MEQQLILSIVKTEQLSNSICMLNFNFSHTLQTNLWISLFSFCRFPSWAFCLQRQRSGRKALLVELLTWLFSMDCWIRMPCTQRRSDTVAQLKHHQIITVLPPCFSVSHLSFLCLCQRYYYFGCVHPITSSKCHWARWWTPSFKAVKCVTNICFHVFSFLQKCKYASAYYLTILLYKE